MIANEAIYVVITSWEHWPIFHPDGEDCGKWLNMHKTILDVVKHFVKVHL